MRHAVLGAGGVGGLMAACLAKSGFEVTLVLRPESVSTHPDRIALASPFGSFSVPVGRTAGAPEADVLWVTVKATQLDAALESLGRADSVGAFVPLLNGIDHVERLRSRFGAARVIPATIAVESELQAPGQVVHRSPFARVNVLSTGRKLLEEPMDRLEKVGFECRFVDDEKTLLWGKLVVLAPVALTTTASREPIGRIVSNPESWERFRGCTREVCEVARAEGAIVEPDRVLSFVLALPGTTRSSMQKDVERGRPPELEAISRPILYGARVHDIDVPVTAALVDEITRQTGLGAAPSRRSSPPVGP